MRLGDQEIDIEKNSLAYELYTKDKIRERHRHRYEVNPDYIEVFEENGVKFSGKNGERMEILEIPSNRFFIATQFHPEFRSSLDEPAPAFLGFVRAMIDFKKDQKVKNLELEMTV
jgi:CTP synthase (UTP-ammonia lyase)